MTTEARIGHGTRFSLGDSNSPASYTELAEVTNITPPGISRDAVEATHMQSPEMYREFVAGLINGGEVTLEMNFIPEGGSTQEIIALFANREAKECRITFYRTNGEVAAYWDFDAIATGFEPEAPIDDKMMATVTFQVTGKPTLTVL